MEKIAIITDTCSDLTQEEMKEYGIFVLPILIQCGDKEYQDGITISVEEVYEMQKTQVLKTASPAGGYIVNLFEQLVEEGYTHAIATLLSGGLSGTVNQVRLIASEIENIEIEVYDSKIAAVGNGAISMTLAEYRNQGLSFNELKDKAEKLIENTTVFFSIDTLEYLQKGGRIGKASAFLGNTLKLKPIMSISKEAGDIVVPAKVRGNKKVPGKLVELVSEIIDNNPGRKFKLVVADGANREGRDKIEAELLEKYPNYIVCYESKIGAALSCYLGPGLLGAGVQFIDD
ncbi:MAG: DegV family protein [Erysipelotrichaceae bacterium]|nr:DegV family protein [Erysipelotrichaceae bacterium]